MNSPTVSAYRAVSHHRKNSRIFVIIITAAAVVAIVWVAWVHFRKSATVAQHVSLPHLTSAQTQAAITALAADSAKNTASATVKTKAIKQLSANASSKNIPSLTDAQKQAAIKSLSEQQ